MSGLPELPGSRTTRRDTRRRSRLPAATCSGYPNYPVAGLPAATRAATALPGRTTAAQCPGSRLPGHEYRRTVRRYGATAAAGHGYRRALDTRRDYPLRCSRNVKQAPRRGAQLPGGPFLFNVNFRAVRVRILKFRARVARRNERRRARRAARAYMRTVRRAPCAVRVRILKFRARVARRNERRTARRAARAYSTAVKLERAAQRAEFTPYTDLVRRRMKRARRAAWLSPSRFSRHYR